MRKKLLLSILLIGMFLIPLSNQFVSAAGDEISYKEENEAVFIQTEFMTVKVVPDQGNIMWWFGNTSSHNEMFKLQLVRITEFQGEDSVLDDKSELGGFNLNFPSAGWDYVIEETTDSLTLTLSLTGLANGADISLIMKVFTTDTPINGTDAVTEGLTELKFDIIVENWDYTALAQGYAIQGYLSEVQKRHQVRVRNGTNAENGNVTRIMQIESEEYGNVPVAYFEWAEVANIVNASEEIVDTIPVGVTYFSELVNPPAGMSGNEGLSHFFLTYPKYNEGLKMVHDPSVGVYEENFTSNNLSMYLVPVLTGLVTVATVVILRKKKK